MGRLVLIVDDEAHMRQLVKIYLQNAGYSTLEAHDGENALIQLENHPVQLVVLDLMMPGMDGWETCSKIRKSYHDIPILMLTARTAVEDKVAGLHMGADDYLTKPFDGRELAARVDALFRRTGTAPEVLHIDDVRLRIDPQGRNVYVDGTEVVLTPKEYELLLLLASHMGRSFSREELLNKIWGSDYFGGTRTVDSHIKNLREKLREAGMVRDPLLTVWGIGYKFEVKP